MKSDLGHVDHFLNPKVQNVNSTSFVSKNIVMWQVKLKKALYYKKCDAVNDKTLFLDLAT